VKAGLKLGITEDDALVGSEELPGWHLYPSAYEEKKMFKLHRNNERTLTIDSLRHVEM
jgi:hypothetical protein